MGGIGTGISALVSGDETNRAGEGGYWAVKNLIDLQTPKIRDMKIKLQSLVQQGVLTPEMADTFLQEVTAYEQMDPTARQALMETVESKGFDPQSRAALYDLQQQIGAQERGGREAILQDAAARGISGSGIEMASQMANQQGNATRLANQGFQSAADANARHLQAVSGLANMDSQKAAAQDAINQFNAANRQAVENLNTGASNAAQAQNLAEKQRIADTNVTTQNAQEMYNKGLYQQDFENRFGRAQALSNANLGQAQSDLGIAQHKAAPTAKWSDKNLKTNIEEVDPHEMMEGLKGYSYEYKDGEGMEEGPQVGVMAQDLEEVAPQAVEETPEGKAIDYSKMGGPMLAALASLNERIDELEKKNG